MKKKTQKHILAQIQENFKTFGAGQQFPGANMTALSLEDGPLVFAAGVDVAEVVALVLRESVAYYSGFKDGIIEYAWWKDGVQYVGTCGKTLKEALEDLSTKDSLTG